MAAGEDRGEELLDDVVLSDDHLLQFLLHQLPVLAELDEDVVEGFRARGRRHGAVPSLAGPRTGDKGRGDPSIGLGTKPRKPAAWHGGFPVGR